MDDWHTTCLGLKRLPRELTAFAIETFFNFSPATEDAGTGAPSCRRVACRSADRSQNAGVPVEMQLYAQGEHGFGLRSTKWSISACPRLVETWLGTIGISE
jgi:hypothetical protein